MTVTPLPKSCVCAGRGVLRLLDGLVPCPKCRTATYTAQRRAEQFAGSWRDGVWVTGAELHRRRRAGVSGEEMSAVIERLRGEVVLLEKQKAETVRVLRNYDRLWHERDVARAELAALKQSLHDIY